MTNTKKVNPRARFWRDQKVAAADRLRTTRALDHDGARTRRGRVAQAVAARMFWRRRSPWEADVV